ncbi:uncharacterized protein LOC135099945 [Scylla paramamosain]|uniref:uncharacterized protein LOC135099945 n=1 Tax=Scylla paramamosain TaxID=85552 RepID=UPI0030839DDF
MFVFLFSGESRVKIGGTRTRRVSEYLSRGLRITKVDVPSPVVVGEGGWLVCEFVEEGQSVYALKWYLGLDEFYRWTPAESPPVKTFPVDGNPLRVDKNASSRGRVKIHDVRLGAAGVFRCEVSGEAPHFHTESGVAEMKVVDLPDKKPLITGVQGSYQMHEDVIVNCSSPRSLPPATLTFYVNDEQADPSWVMQYPTYEDPESGLETSILGLRFPLRPRLLRGGIAEVKCTASILNKYWESSVVSVYSDMPYHASIMEGRAATGTGCLAATSSTATPLLLVLLLLLLLR